MKVIAAVFISETNRICAADTELCVSRKQKHIESQTRELRGLFLELDRAGRGCLTIDEFVNAFEDPLIRTWASTLDIDTSDLTNMFRTLDDGDGIVDIDEFLFGMQRAKGFAKASDVVRMVKLLKNLDDKLDDLLSAQHVGKCNTAETKIRRRTTLLLA